MQLMPHTGNAFGATLPDLLDPGNNIRAGSRYLAACLERYPDVRRALAAFRAGPTHWETSRGGHNNPGGRLFAAKVLGWRRGYTGLLGQDIVRR